MAVLQARKEFARRTVDEQVGTLERIRDGIVTVGEGVGEEFAETIAGLDRANDRLQAALERLRGTVVEASLRKVRGDEGDEGGWEENTTGDDAASSRDEVGGGGGGGEKTLHDFIDETNHNSLQASLRGLIDSHNDARADLDTTIQHFDDSLATITTLLSDPPLQKDALAAQHTIYDDADDDEPPPSITHLFRGMEDHAAEMATLLQSLVAHYDLCVTALKHTSGGNEAAQKALQSAESGTHSPNPTNTEAEEEEEEEEEEEALTVGVPDPPISPREREEMYRILQTDSAEVPDVLHELKDRSLEQETLYTSLLSACTSTRRTHHNLTRVRDLLNEIHVFHLPTHISALKLFPQTWLRHRSALDTQTSQLASLASFYESFLDGYARLLGEVERREAVEAQMRKVAAKARRELERLGEADGRARGQFVEEVGGVLPVGIWGGMGVGGLRWEVREVREGNGE